MYRILIADDERLEREAFKYIINKGLDFPIEVQEAKNGREAIVKARTYKPDIIFMDIKMPGIDGIEAARSIKKEFPQTELIFLTAFNQFEYARDAIHIGASDYLIKPSSEKDILKITTSLIEKIDHLQTEMNIIKNNELKLSRASGYLENEFIYAMAVRGLNQEKFLNYISILDLNFFSGRGGIMKIFYDTYPLTVETDYQKSILKKRCNLILKNYLTTFDLNVVSNLELSSVYFMINFQENCSITKDSEFAEIIHYLEKEIKNELSIHVKIGTGSLFRTSADTLNSFSEASKALGRVDPLNLNRNNSQSDSHTRFPMYLEVEIEKAILKGDREEAIDIFNAIAAWFVGSTESFENRKQNILELATVLKHSAACQDPEGISHEDDSEIKQSESPEVLLTSFQIFLNNLLKHIDGIPEAENGSAINDACRFIEANFNRDIGLEDAAAHCRLSSFYFSRLFKKRKNITFIEYLTGRRLVEAKSLLSTSLLSIKEISSNIGYNDPNYFTRVFKRAENISPSEYRSKYLQKRQ